MEEDINDIINKMNTGMNLSEVKEPSADSNAAFELDDNAAFEIHVYREMHEQITSEINDIKDQIRKLRTKIKSKTLDLEEQYIELSQKELDIKMVWAKAKNDQAAIAELELEENEISNRRENFNEKVFTDSKRDFVIKRKRQKVDTLYCPDESDQEYWTSE